MQTSQKAEYAVRAALDLAIHAGQAAGARSADIAKRTGVPEKFLDAILLELRRHGFVQSKRGPNGGHWLVLPPDRVTVGAILRAIDGPWAADSGARQAGTPEDVCLRELWRRASAAAGGVFDDVTLADLHVQAGIQGAADFCI